MSERPDLRVTDGADGVPTGKAYWRSVERLLASPAVQEELQRELDSELPPGALDAPDEVSRRSVLQLLAASFGLAGLTACRRPVEHIVPYARPPEDVIPGIPQRYATTLPHGTEALGVLVESHEGRPTKIEGNPRHPASHGAASAWAQAALLDLYDPDRADRVRIRVTEAEREEASDWDAFGKWWAGRAAALAGDGGSTLAVVAAPFASPTLARLARELHARYPAMRWVTWDPLSEEALFAGNGGLRPVYHLDRAKAAVAIDCDLLLTDANAVHNSWTFAEARRPERTDGMLRLYAVEGVLSLTGANADHRLALRPRQLPAFVAALAKELGVAAPGLPAPAALPPPVVARAAVMARDLRAAGAGGLVAVGRRQPAAVHAAALAINRALGSVGAAGSTAAVTLHPLDDVATSSVEDLRELTTAMAAGQVETLIVLGGNPLHDAPADLRFGEALAKVPDVVCLSPYRHETGRACQWHLPEAHALEAWGDARGVDGTASVMQPLVAPLLNGISRVELLGLMATGAPQSGHELVLATWSAGGAASNADQLAWRRILHDGVAPAGSLAGNGPVRFRRGAPQPATAAAAAGGATAGAADATPAGALPPAAAAPSPAPATSPNAAAAIPAGDPNKEVTTQGVGGGPVAAEAALQEQAAAAPTSEIDLVILPSPNVWDGAFANNAWVQELPHPLSKLTWDNAAYLAPSLAGELDVETGDRLLVVANGNRAGLPVMVLPGMPERTIAVELGYGRRGVGRVADGVGGDVYPLRSSAALWGAFGCEAHKTWYGPEQRGHQLGITQTHWEIAGRPLVREASLEEYRRKPDFAHEPDAEHEKAIPLWSDPVSWDEGPQWAMAIDLSACTGCNACVVACQAENNVPVVGREMVTRAREMHWLRVDRYFAGEPESPEVVFQPVPCMHCENAPCEQVCPVAATVHDHNGLNAMVYNRCIGTRYCSNNCPYKVRRFNFFNYTKDTPELMKLAMNPDVTVRSRGVMEKCTYCVQRISEARQTAKLAGRNVADGEIQTACQQTCPTQAIVFGDKTDAKSRVMQRKGLPRDYVLLGELNNRPRTSYQAKVRNPNPEWV
jgi:molybdopterin-containing oxidoreductase family iron-sulfur binding subunit